MAWPLSRAEWTGDTVQSFSGIAAMLLVASEAVVRPLGNHPQGSGNISGYIPHPTTEHISYTAYPLGPAISVPGQKQPSAIVSSYGSFVPTRDM